MVTFRNSLQILVSLLLRSSENFMLTWGLCAGIWGSFLFLIVLRSSSKEDLELSNCLKVGQPEERWKLLGIASGETPGVNG